MCATSSFPELPQSAYVALSEADTVRSVPPDLKNSPILIWRDQTGASYKTSNSGVSINFNSADIKLNGSALSATPISHGKIEIEILISTIVKGEDVRLLSKAKRDLFVTLGFPKTPFSAERRPWRRLLEWSAVAAQGSLNEAEAMRSLVEKIAGLGAQKSALLSWEDEGRYATPPGNNDVWSRPHTDVPGLIAAFSRSKGAPIRSNCYTFAGLLQASAASLGVNAKVRMFSLKNSSQRKMAIQPGIGVTTDLEEPKDFNVHALVVYGKESLVSDANIFIKENRQPISGVTWPSYLRDAFGLNEGDVEWQDYVPRPVLPDFNGK